MNSALLYRTGIALLLLTGGCLHYSVKSGMSEVILFMTTGNSPFQDYAYTIQSDGSRPKRLLTPKRGRSYMYASGNSLRSHLAVTVHETSSAGKVENHLYTYRPSSGEWRSLVTEGSVGEALVSPDDSKVVFAFAPPHPPKQIRLWVADLKTGEKKNLSGYVNEDGIWDGYACWRPDGKEVAFLRMRYSPAGITTTLMRVPVSGGEPTILMGEEEGVVAVCYAPDGNSLAIRTDKGLEIVRLPKLERKVIAHESNFPNSYFYVGGVIWSRTQDKLAFSSFNRKTTQYELWTVSSSGGNAQRIHSQSEQEGRIVVTSFVQE